MEDSFSIEPPASKRGKVFLCASEKHSDMVRLVHKTGSYNVLETGDGVCMTHKVVLVIASNFLKMRID